MSISDKKVPTWTADTPITVEQMNRLAEGTNEALKQLDENVTRNQEAVVGEGQDLNGYVSPGIWQWQRKDYATDNPNAPVGCEGYGLFIVEVGGNYIRQTIHLHNSEDAGRCWQRLCQKVGGGANWTAWKENFSEARKPDSMRITRTDEANICEGLTKDTLWLNCRGADSEIKYTKVLNGRGDGQYSELIAKKLHGREGVYDGDDRVYSPNNVPDKTQVYSTNEMNLDYGFARDDGTIYFNYRGAEKPIQRYALWGGQPTVGHVDLVAKAYYEGDERVYSPNNKPTAADTGAVPGQLYYRGSARKTLVPGNYMVFNPASIVDNTNAIYISGSLILFSIVADRNGKHRLRGMCDGTYIEYTSTEFSVQNYEMVHDISIYKLA